MLSITTDYVTDTGNPRPYLEAVAQAGFTHIHWCHHWNTDFVYMDSEVAQIQSWLADYGLALLDVHGSDGREKNWVSPLEHERLAGVELVQNRIDFAHRLGSDVVVMHIFEPREEAEKAAFWDNARRSLDALQPYARARGVRLALENLVRLRLGAEPPLGPEDAESNFPTLARLFALYPADYLGMCYDSGHAHIGRDRLAEVARLKDRILSLHLHDNDGEGDLHKLLFTGSIDWAAAAQVIAESAYTRCISMEVSIRRMEMDDEKAFLAQAWESGNRFAAMVAALR